MAKNFTHGNGLAYSYIRMSTREQVKSGDSLRRQLELTTSYCTRNNLELKTDLTFQDLGVSARKGKNLTEGKLGALIKATTDGRIPKNTNIICESLDRLSRQSFDKSCTLFFDLLNQDFIIHTLNPGGIYTKDDLTKNPMNVMMGLISFIRSYEENELKSERLKEAWQEKRDSLGKGIHTRITPMWLTVINNSYEPIPEKVNLVNEIFDLYIGGKGSGVICCELNKRKIPSFKGKTWNRSAVLKMLNNESVLGYHQPRLHQEGRPIACPPVKLFPSIVSEAKFYRAKELLALSRTLPAGGRNGDMVTNLFQGLMINKEDDSKIVVVNKGKKASGSHLVQSTAMRGVGTTTYAPFPYQAFESLFLFLFNQIEPNSLISPEESKDDNNIILNDKYAQLRDSDSKLALLLDKIKNDPELGDILFLTIKELNKDKKTLEAEIEVLRSKMLKNKSPVTATRELLDLALSFKKNPDKTEYTNFRFKLRCAIKEMISQITIEVIKDRNDKSGVGRTCHALVHYRNKLYQKFRIARTRHYNRIQRNPVPYSVYTALISEPGPDQANLPFVRGSTLDESYSNDVTGWEFVKENEGALWDLGLVCYELTPDGRALDELEPLKFPLG